MKRIILATSITALVLFFARSWANPAPKVNNFVNFSGTWRMDAERSESAHFGERFVPVTVIIKQTAAQVSVETRRGGESETLIYKLDGSVNAQAPQANGPVSWRAHLDGATLVTETTRNINGATVVITDIRSLNATTKRMTVYRTLAVQHGYDSNGKASSTAKDVFIKAS